MVVVREQRDAQLGVGIEGRRGDEGEEAVVDGGGIVGCVFGGRGLEALH